MHLKRTACVLELALINDVREERTCRRGENTAGSIAEDPENKEDDYVRSGF